MCGIAGFLLNELDTPHAGRLNLVIREMCDTLVSRGPDHQGAWVDPAVGIALGHRRLSLLDLTSAGSQPMQLESRSAVISFNGEIYNHLDLRTELQKLGFRHTWRGHSDTETLLAAVEYWGVEEALQRCIGMFAFALWDRDSKVLTLARDRLGEKPLYYGWSSQGAQCAFVFGSELKAIRMYPSFDASISKAALAQYVRFSYIPCPLSIYEGIFKLPPGCLLRIEGKPPLHPPSQPIETGQRYDSIILTRWWALEKVVEDSRVRPIETESQAINALESTLARAVSGQSKADVPLGALLSGGVDSSTIVALMQRNSPERVKTFTIGFDEEGFDESRHALAVAKHLGTEHHEMHVSSRTAQDVIPSLPCIYDEPFADSSQIPTYLVCRAAKTHVTAVLSGDGGDELFGGYNRYFWGQRIWNRLAWVPFPLRRLMGRVTSAVPIDTWDRASQLTDIPRLGDKAHRLANRLSQIESSDDLYWSLVSEWDPASVLLSAGEDGRSALENNRNGPLDLNSVERMMFRDALTYLPDDILCKVDRAAMACSLETRVPFLDHRVVKLAWQLPLSMKIRRHTGKWALRQVLYRHVPQTIIERPKAGFAIPIGQWLRGPLREWADNLLDETKIRHQGYFNAGPIREAWAQHLSGRRDQTRKIWIILMFQAWLEDQNKSTSEYHMSP